MRIASGTRWAALGLGLAGAPALATVKDGADAWKRGDYTTAVQQWRAPAIAGDPDAQFDLGQAYKLGRGVPADLAQAELWYARAAAQGHEQAQDAYGLALFQEGKKGDAAPWLEKSVARDERRAELILGIMLFNGDAVSKDWVRAYALVARSSRQGLDQASQKLAELDGYVTPEQRQQGLAMAADIEARAQAARLQAPAAPTPPVVVAAADARGRPHPAAPIAVTPPVKRAPAPKPTPDATPTPAPSPAPAHAGPARPAPPAAPGGKWRVQLGAFREPGAAQALWAKVGARVGGQPSYVKAGAVTRLQAGPFAGKADAERACRAAGVSCVVVP